MPVSQGALGVFDISMRAAFVGVCDIGLTGVILPVGISAGTADGSSVVSAGAEPSSPDPLVRLLVDSADTVCTSDNTDSTPDIDTSVLDGGTDSSADVVSISDMGWGPILTSNLKRLGGTSSVSILIAGDRARFVLVLAEEATAINVRLAAN